MENSVDPDKMASKRNADQDLVFSRTDSTGHCEVNSGFSSTRVNSNLTFKWGENLPVYLKLFDTCACHKLLKQHLFKWTLYSQGQG